MRRIPLFGRAELSRFEGHRAKLAFVFLLEHSAYCVAARVCGYHEVAVWVWRQEDWCRGDCSLEADKSYFMPQLPFENDTFDGQIRQGRCYEGVFQDVSPIDIDQPEERPHFCRVPRPRPFPDGVHLAWFHVDASCSHHVSQEVHLCLGEFAFAQFCVQLVFPQHRQDLLEVCGVLWL